MLNRKQFSRKFAQEYGYTYRASDRMVRDIFEFLGKSLFQDGENVTILGFGSFKHRTAKAKCVRHPKTGEIIEQPERDFIKFIPSELLTPKDE